VDFLGRTCARLRTRSKHQLQRIVSAYLGNDAGYVATNSFEQKPVFINGHRRSWMFEDRDISKHLEKPGPERICTFTAPNRRRVSPEALILVRLSFANEISVAVGPSDVEFFVQDNFVGRTDEPGVLRDEKKQERVRAPHWQTAHLFHRRLEHATGGHVRYPTTDSALKDVHRVRWNVRPGQATELEVFRRRS